MCQCYCSNAVSMLPVYILIGYIEIVEININLLNASHDIFSFQVRLYSVALLAIARPVITVIFYLIVYK